MAPRMVQMPDGTYTYVDDSTGAPTTGDQNANPYGTTAAPGSTDTGGGATGSSGSSIDLSALGAVPGLQDAMTRFVNAGPSEALDQYGIFDPNYEAAKQAYTAATNNANTAYSTGIQNLQNYINPQYGQLAQQNAQDQQTLQNQMALQGIGRSQGNLVGSSRLADQYQNAVDALNNQLASGTSALGTQKTNDLTNALNALQTAKGSYAGNVAQQLLARAGQAANANTQAQLAASIAAQYQPVNSPQQQAIQYAQGANPIGLLAPAAGTSSYIAPQSQAAPQAPADINSPGYIDAILRQLGIYQ